MRYGDHDGWHGNFRARRDAGGDPRCAGKRVAGFRRSNADAIADAGEDGDFVAGDGGRARRVFDCESAGQTVGGARMPGNSRAGHPRRAGASARRKSARAKIKWTRLDEKLITCASRSPTGATSAVSTACRKVTRAGKASRTI